MGFIEDARTMLAKEKEAQRTAEKIRKQEESRGIVREAQDRANLRRAIEQFKQSGLGRMIKQLGKIDGCRHVYTNERGFDERDRSQEVAYNVSIDIDTHSDNSSFSSSTTNRGIEITVAASGTIKFRGGPAGSSVLRKEEWQGNPNVVEEALGKAYRNPIISTTSSYNQQA